MAKTQKPAAKIAGRPSVIRGRPSVVSLIITPAAKELLDARRGPLSTGDAFETIVRKYGDRVKMPKAAIKTVSTRWAPKRFEGRTEQLRVRMSDLAIGILDAKATASNSVRSDVAEALIQQFADKLTKEQTR